MYLAEVEVSNWDESPCESVQEEVVLSSSNFNERVRLIVTFEEVSECWLQALQSANVGTLQDGLSLGVNLQLGARTIHPHQRTFGDTFDEFDHHFSCIRRLTGYSEK